MMTWLSLPGIALALVVGCISVKQTRIEPGMTRQALLAELGPALSETRNPDGTTAATFGFPHTAQQVKVIFDKDGKVVSSGLHP